MQLNIKITTTRFNYSLSSAWINSFVPHTNYVKQGVLSPLNRWRNWGAEMLHNLLRLRQLISHRAELPAQAVCDLNHGTTAASSASLHFLHPCKIWTFTYQHFQISWEQWLVNLKWSREAGNAQTLVIFQTLWQLVPENILHGGKKDQRLGFRELRMSQLCYEFCLLCAGAGYSSSPA